jgi:hypothetical protein
MYMSEETDSKSSIFHRKKQTIYHAYHGIFSTTALNLSAAQSQLFIRVLEDNKM